MAYKEAIAVTMHVIAKIGPEYLRIVNKILIDCLCDVLFKLDTKHLMKTIHIFALLDKHHWSNTKLC